MDKLTPAEILSQTLKRFGLSIWEAHTDKMNRMIALEAMQKLANQETSELQKQNEELINGLKRVINCNDFSTAQEYASEALSKYNKI